MTRVGFIHEGPSFQGTINYLRNLFSALALLPGNPIRPVVFVGKTATADLVAALRDAEVVRTSLLDERSLAGRSRRRWKRMASGRDPLLTALLRLHRIGIVSHSGSFPGSRLKSVGWIPDFQHVHLPKFFTTDERARRDAEFRALTDDCDRIILSSVAAQRDFESFAPAALTKTRVLQFVPSIEGIELVSLESLAAKYSFAPPYFYMPNQFWIHKNHAIVIDALAILKARGRAATVLMTGNTADYRHPDHFDRLMAKAAEAGVADSFRTLGVVPYADLISLMQHATAILNPSLFEGWSSSVEEAKALDKCVLLSDLPVHLEQNPSRGMFFDPADANALADRMMQVLDEHDAAHPPVTALTLSPSYLDNRLRFAETYRRIVVELSESAA